MPRPPDEQQKYDHPKTRLTDAWHLAWQRYYGVGPRGPIRVRNVIVPNMRRLAYKHRVRH